MLVARLVKWSAVSRERSPFPKPDKKGDYWPSSIYWVLIGFEDWFGVFI